MKTFKEFLVEKVFFKSSIEALKGIAGRSKYKTSRFIIGHDDELIGADAGDHFHSEMKPNTFHEPHKAVGFVHQRKNGSYLFATYDGAVEDHPILKSMENTHKMERGCTNQIPDLGSMG